VFGLRKGFPWWEKRALLPSVQKKAYRGGGAQETFISNRERSAEEEKLDTGNGGK